MKKISTISLFIFGVVVIAILVAGLVFYQNNKGGQTADSSQSGNLVQGTLSKITAAGSLTLDMPEISKHNKQSDCWLLISGKVYDITSFFGSHPGGSKVMAATCGTDATIAYMTQDPNATSSTNRSAHSSKATNMLTSYYLGDFNQKIGGQNKIVTPTTTQVTNQTNTTSTVTTPKVVPPVSTNLTLSAQEVAKHNKQSDCWFIISGKVYDITSFFGSHPGGSSVMAATCGTDATNAYMTKDPNATSSTSRQAHSSRATSMLSSYYLGDLNQTVGSNTIKTSPIVSTPSYNNTKYEDD